MDAISVILDVPKIGQKVRLTRPTFIEAKDGKMWLSSSLCGKVTNVAVREIIIQIDKEQGILDRFEEALFEQFKQLVPDRHIIFSKDIPFEHNGMNIGGIVEFHFTCEYVEAV